MRRSSLVLLVVLGAFITTCRTAPQSATPASPADAAMAAERDHDVQELLERIASRENEPAEKVFKNIQVMKGVPAGRLLRIMNVGYSQSLGVKCEHCHVEDYWEVDEKRPKRAAREMIVMTRGLNQQLAGMQNLESDERTVNCGTCHRGEVRPASTTRR